MNYENVHSGLLDRDTFLLISCFIKSMTSQAKYFLTSAIEKMILFFLHANLQYPCSPLTWIEVVANWHGFPCLDYRCWNKLPLLQVTLPNQGMLCLQQNVFVANTYAFVYTNMKFFYCDFHMIWLYGLHANRWKGGSI